MNTNKISIKIIGENNRVLNTLEKIESVFPLSVRSKIMPNDDGLNVHCWLTVAIDLPRQEIGQHATATPSFNLTELTSK